MSRLDDMKAYILNDVVLSALATEQKYEELADILNAMTVSKLGPVAPTWLMAFLGIEGLWIKILKISLNEALPDTDIIKNGCAILVNYLQSGNPNPLDFGAPETHAMLQGFLAAGIITQTQHDKIVTKCSYNVPFVVDTWGGSLTSADELRGIEAV